jgi:hypothetical protein
VRVFCFLFSAGDFLCDEIRAVRRWLAAMGLVFLKQGYTWVTRLQRRGGKQKAQSFELG